MGTRIVCANQILSYNMFHCLRRHYSGWVGKLNHIAIATHNAAEHVKFFRDVMCLPVSERKVSV